MWAKGAGKKEKGCTTDRVQEPTMRWPPVHLRSGDGGVDENGRGRGGEERVGKAECCCRVSHPSGLGGACMWLFYV